MVSHRSPPVELLPPAEAPGVGVTGSDFLIEVTLPNICRRITIPMYATEKSKIVFGERVHPSASSLKNDKLFALFYDLFSPPRGFLPLVLWPAIFLAISLLSVCSVMFFS